jgi:hypothetical protein
MTDWVTINKHLQTVGTATCDVSNLLLEADEMKRAGLHVASFYLASAARDVLRNRQQHAQSMSERIRRAQSRRPVSKTKAQTGR